MSILLSGETVISAGVTDHATAKITSSRPSASDFFVMTSTTYNYKYINYNYKYINLWYKVKVAIVLTEMHVYIWFKRN